MSKNSEQLKGRNKRTGEEAFVFSQFDLLREWHKAGELVCPFCDGELVTNIEHLRQGDWVRAYLRHKSECSTTLEHHPESPEHLSSKKKILETAAARFGYDLANADCEVRMPEINRIADVCFTLKTGEKIVHEAQLASISTDELEARTNDYQKLGYGIIWHLGKSADTQTNRRWVWKRLGGCCLLGFNESLND